ncbi:hypothetical protein, partial [Halochromatium roseum]|uniref:hypothetical protein n=1 Tax=Halochromatium roseum TaxID=391920 RepID=UPI001A93566E
QAVLDRDKAPEGGACLWFASDENGSHLKGLVALPRALQAPFALLRQRKRSGAAGAGWPKIAAAQMSQLEILLTDLAQAV